MPTFDVLTSNMIWDLQARRSTWLIEFYSWDISKSIIFILWNSNEMFYFRERECVFKDTCTSWVNGFSSEENTQKSPLGLHKIWRIIWHGSSENAIIKWRQLTWENVETLKYWENWVWIVSRVITLQWLETGINTNTESRHVYIHGTRHWWFWEEKDSYNNISLRRSPWCFWLRPRNIIKLCNEIEKRGLKNTLVYIFWES